MHQVNRQLEHCNSEQREIRLMLILSTALDRELLSKCFAQHARLQVVESTSDLDYGLVRCQRLNPDVMVIDPKLSSNAAQRASEEVRSGHVENVIVLDDRVHEGRLAMLLDLPKVSYFTRHAGLEALCEAVLQVEGTGERIFDPLVVRRVHRTTRGWRLDQPHDQPSIATLTTRELQVMQLLAEGRSVRDCAKQMKLAESTVDNHKSRLMRKLNVHKAVELTRVAIRDGLITV